jgi:hypothetical protein
MKKLIITVEFTHNNDKWSWTSGIKNNPIDYYPEKETIHDLVKRVCEYKGMELTHGGKPLLHLINDEDEQNGYAYRGKSMTDGDYGRKPRMVYWSIWVHISEIIPFDFEKENNKNNKSDLKALAA